MAYVCFNCNKGSQYGTQHRHRPGVAGRQHYRRATHTPKQFKPNLQTAYITIDGLTKKVKLCTKCRRLYKEEGLITVWTKQDVQKEAGKKQDIKTKEVKTIVKEAPVVKQTKIEKTKAKPQKETKKVEKKTTKKTKEEPKTPAISVEDLVGKKN